MGAIYLNENESQYPKEPTKFDDFTYDNTNNQLFNLIDEIRLTCAKICGDVSDINNDLNGIKNAYGGEYSYHSYIDDASVTLNQNLDDFRQLYRTVLNKMSEDISDIEEKDNELISELENITAKLEEGE